MQQQKQIIHFHQNLSPFHRYRHTQKKNQIEIRRVEVYFSNLGFSYVFFSLLAFFSTHTQNYIYLTKDLEQKQGLKEQKDKSEIK